MVAARWLDRLDVDVLSVAWAALSERDRVLLRTVRTRERVALIADQLGVSPSRVRQLDRKAMSAFESRLLEFSTSGNDPQAFSSANSVIDQCTAAFDVSRDDVIAWMVLAGYEPLRWRGVPQAGMWLQDRSADPIGDWERSLTDLMPLTGPQLDRALAETGSCVHLRAVLRENVMQLAQHTDGLGWWRPRHETRDLAILALAQADEPLTAAQVAKRIGRSQQAVTMALARSSRARLLEPGSRWQHCTSEAVSAGQHRPTLEEAMVQVVEQHGPISRQRLFDETRKLYPVRDTRMGQVLRASAVIGRFRDRTYGLVRDGAVPFQPSPTRRPKSAHFDAEAQLLRVGVTRPDHYRNGASLPLPSWVGWQMGFRQVGASRVFATQSGGRTLTVRLNSDGVAMSSLSGLVGSDLPAFAEFSFDLTHDSVAYRETDAPVSY